MAKIQRYILLIFFFSINFEMWDPFQLSFPISTSKLTGLLYLVSVLPQLPQFLSREGTSWYMRPIWWFFAFLTLMSLVNVNAYFSSFFDRTIFQNILLLWILMNHERMDEGILDKGMLFFALGSFVLSMLYFAGIGIGYTGERVTLFGDNQNNVGIRMSVSMIVLLGTVFLNRLRLGWWRFLLLLPLPFMLFLMLATGSRVAFIAFVLALVIGVLLMRTRRVTAKFLVIVLGGMGLILVWMVLMESYNMRSRLLDSLLSGDLSGRDDIWRSIMPMLLDNLFIGIGKTGYYYFSMGLLGEVKSPHNVVLEVIAYTGLVGLSMYMLFLYRLFRSSIFVYRADRNLLPLLLLIPIAGMLLSGHLLNVKIGWIIFAYVAGVSLYKAVPEQDNTNETVLE